MGILFGVVVLIFVLFIMFLAIGGDKVVDKVADGAIPVEVGEGVEVVEDNNSDFLDFIKQSWYGDYKLNQLPKSFKIGNVYFDKISSSCKFFERSYQEYGGRGKWSTSLYLLWNVNIEIKSYVFLESKVYDNGGYIHKGARTAEQGIYSTYITYDPRVFENKDLRDYILNNLDKVEEVN